MVGKFLAFVFLLSLNIYAQNISAEAYTDSANYLVGDYINLTVKVKYDEGIQVSNPLIGETFKDIEIIEVKDPVLLEENGKQVVEFQYIVSVYDSLDVSIPGIPVGYKTGNDTTLQTVNTNPINFTVHTVAVQPEEDIKDVKEPIKIPLDWKMVLLYLLIILAVAATAYFLYKRYKKKLEGKEDIEETAPRLPSYITALNNLHQLEEEELWQKGRVKDYHSRITEIIRRYFEERFYLPALELTTTEVMRRLKERYDTTEILKTTEEFLNNADLVKFAKYNPVPDLNKEMMKQAYQIVEKTIPKERETSREVLRNAG
ncbi:MAG: hypothetical protein A2V93_09800 [Ignavibacteria bacterium RBG_16_34_14]|nr:MAG: hypothetical protein A2V93_09800 [Ignavibacteria bacterium RBG_16_34_14]